MFFSKKKIIGLDIGTSSIKIAELDVGRRGTSISSFAMIETPSGSIENGEVIEPSVVSGAIKSLLLEAKSKRKHAATGLWGTSVIVKKITIPKMDENLIGEQIRWEAEQYIPYDINEVNLEFQVLRQSSSPETMDIILVAAVQQSILKVIEIVELSGLSCEIVDVEGFALANCFEINYPEAQNQTVGILNIGASVTNFVIVDKGEIIFCRDIPVGGLTYSNELQKSLNISPGEAEAMKLSYAHGQPAAEEASQIISSTHEIVADEVRSSIDFFMNTTSKSPVRQYYITGGSVRMPGLLEKLGAIAPCEKLDPLRQIKASSSHLSASYLDSIKDFAAVAIGLGVRNLGDS